MFRCPNCAQGEAMVYTGRTLPTGGAYVFTVTQNPLLTEATLSAQLMGKEVTITEEIKQEFLNSDAGYQAYCKNCMASEPVDKWIHAFERPMEYFEADNLCRCGGELWMDQIPGTQRFAFVCEDCDWIKPGAMINGGEGL